MDKTNFIFYMIGELGCFHFFDDMFVDEEYGLDDLCGAGFGYDYSLYGTGIYRFLYGFEDGDGNGYGTITRG